MVSRKMTVTDYNDLLLHVGHRITYYIVLFEMFNDILMNKFVLRAGKSILYKKKVDRALSLLDKDQLRIY